MFDDVARKRDSSCEHADTLLPQKLHNKNTDRVCFGGVHICPIVISK